MGKVLSNKATFYSLLWCVYSLQGVLYEESGLLSKSIMLIILLLSIYHTVYCNMKFKLPAMLKALNWLLIVFVLYGVFRIFESNTHFAISEIASYDYLKKILLSLLPIFSYYYYTLRGFLSEKWFQKWIIVFLLLNVALFFRAQNAMINMFLLSTDEITNNSGYLFVAMFPMIVFLSKKIKLQYILIAVLGAFTLLSMKRGAALCFVICTIYFIFGSLKQISLRKKASIVFLSIVVVCLFIMMVEKFLETNAFFGQRIMDIQSGNSSGRDDLYGFFWNYYLNKMSLVEQLFGIGADGTLKVYYNYAHNDWLEIAINQGFVGLSAFFIFWIVFYKSCRALRYDKKLHLALSLCLIYSLSKTLFSMSINDFQIYESCVIGYCLCRINRCKYETV